MDEVRGKASHAKAKRVNAAVKEAAQAQLRNVEEQLRALETGTPFEAAAILLPAAFLSAMTKTEISLEAVASGLRATRDRLVTFLSRGGRK